MIDGFGCDYGSIRVPLEHLVVGHVLVVKISSSTFHTSPRAEACSRHRGGDEAPPGLGSTGICMGSCPFWAREMCKFLARRSFSRVGLFYFS